MADTIFMIHGMWGGSWYWANYKDYFEKNGYNCLTTTLRFHDMDPKDAPNPQLGVTSLLDYAEDLENEIKQLDVKPVIMGHSMGGLLAQILGSRGLAKALVLCAPASPAGNTALLHLSVIKSFMSVMSKWGFWKLPNRQTFDEAVYSMLHLLPLEQQKETYEKFVYESGRAGTEIGCWFLDSKKASKVDAVNVTCPVLVISGTQDRITPGATHKQIAKKYKAVSSLKEYPNHAHWVVAEPGWEEITADILNWLNSL